MPSLSGPALLLNLIVDSPMVFEWDTYPQKTGTKPLGARFSVERGSSAHPHHGLEAVAVTVQELWTSFHFLRF
ncbi:hypothetical protein BD310DRAFT_979925 [Dichomitus squalens]|uniref:Uncharacterized protein n=1 Tax=Dichomitus squalens TaxID=114155 RepID=A0A4Q9PLH4_9APHY|nr:hypothetical protein BD310DRAFT_979925 [Dichomitus squalens]